MPHFENIDKYEATNPQSGRKEIIPIAPHSLQASEYRPRKREGSAGLKKEKVPDFPEVEIEPISVEQMEREFKQAARKENRRRSHRKVSLWKKLSNWLSGLFAKKPQREGSQKPRHRRPRPERKQGSSQGNKKPQDAHGQDSSNPNRRRRRRNRSGNRERKPGQGNQSEGRSRDRDGSRDGGKDRQAQGSSQEGRKRSRNRRNRKRPSGKNQDSSGRNQNPPGN